MTAALVALILSMPVGPLPDSLHLQVLVHACADYYEVDGNLVCCLAQEESQWNPNAYNRAEDAAGLFQWRPESWRVARKAMGRDADLNLRFDPAENIVTTCYAMQRGWEWWPTMGKCRKEVKEWPATF